MSKCKNCGKARNYHYLQEDGTRTCDYDIALELASLAQYDPIGVEKMKKPKIIQIFVENFNGRIIALCDDGSIWKQWFDSADMTKNRWIEIPGPERKAL